MFGPLDDALDDPVDPTDQFASAEGFRLPLARTRRRGHPLVVGLGRAAAEDSDRQGYGPVCEAAPPHGPVQANSRQPVSIQVGHSGKAA